MKKFKKTWKSCVALACVASMSLGTITVFAADCTEGNHIPGEEWFESGYTECYGGWEDDFTYCMECGAMVNAEGKE